MKLDQETRNKILLQCEDCSRTGTYKCKLILDKDGKCMFFEKYDKDNINCFGGY